LAKVGGLKLALIGLGNNWGVKLFFPKFQVRNWDGFPFLLNWLGTWWPYLRLFKIAVTSKGVLVGLGWFQFTQLGERRLLRPFFKELLMG